MRFAGSLIATFLFATLAAFGSEAEITFRKGNQLYTEGKFDESIQAYEKLVEVRYINPELYYNLANAYYRKGKLGNALLNYKRTLLLDPKSLEASKNIALVSKELDAPTILREPILPLPDFLRTLPKDVLVWTGAITAWLFLILLILRLTKSKSGWLIPLAVVSICVAMFCAFLHFVIQSGEPDPNIYQVVSDEAQMKTAPLESGEAIANIQVGTEVTFIRKEGGWASVATSSGEVGFVPIETIKPLRVW